MEYQVTLEPSGHSFAAHEQETILEAGLRAGLNLKYQCDNGSCGECAARLLDGDIEVRNKTDFCFTEVQKDLGFILPCTCIAKNDVVLEATEYHDADQMPYQEVTAKIKKIQHLSDDILVLQLRTPRTHTLQFLAGQSVTLVLPNDKAQALAIASCPCNGMLLEFHIRKSDNEFSQYLFNQAKNNQEILVQGPVGDFILDEESERSLLFIAYDTGFAGVKSLIEHAIALEIAQDIHLFRIACKPEEDYMHNICRAWADAIDNLHYHAFEHCIPIDCTDEKKAKVCSQFMLELEKGDEALIAGSDVYLSGVEEMVANLGQTLIKRGLHEDRLFVQRVI